MAKGVKAVSWIPECRYVTAIGYLATGILPRHDGLHPQMAGLDIPGVSVSQGQEGVTLRIDDSLLFPSSDVLTPQGQVVLERLSVLQAFDGQISVEGHTDNVPIATARFRLTGTLRGRAIAVVRQLERQGIAISMRAVGYADTQPMESNATAEGRAANRRVELLLKQQVRGKEISRGYLRVEASFATDSCKTLMAWADAAMYQAKHSGRNRVEVAEERALNPEEQVPL